MLSTALILIILLPILCCIFCVMGMCSCCSPKQEKVVIVQQPAPSPREVVVAK